MRHIPLNEQRATIDSFYRSGTQQDPVTLRRWLAGKKVRPSLAVPYDGRTLWRWTDADVENLRKYKTTHYRKGRGRKKDKKSKV